nr:MFS transporter [Chloroflexota bacterium]
MVGTARRTPFHYGWIVVAVTSLTLLIAAGVRSAPGVLIHPLEMEFGWSRSSISLAVSIGLLLYGLAGPAAGALMDRFGPTRLMMIGVALTAISTALAAAMSALWQLNLLWGVFSGLGTGIAATVLGATVANRWFVARRGLVIGIFGAATSAGQLLFVPFLMWMVTGAGWRAASLVLAACAAALLVPIVIFMRDDPAAVGFRPFGAPPLTDASLNQSQPAEGTIEVMRRALRTPMFWLLAGSFFICGATSTGLIGTHFLP